jgi:glycosyltransferase involved in cell wall biosynthesis
MISEGIPEEKFIALYNGVDIEYFTPQKKDLALANEFGMLNGEQVIGSFSNFYPIKGVEYFIESIPVILKRKSNVKFLLVGDGILHKHLEKRVRNLGIQKNVVFTGRRSNINALYSIVDISVNSSTTEGFSNAIIESLAMGVPVIATNVGGNPEAVTDGKNGFLVPVGEPKKIADAAIRIIDDTNLLSMMKINSRKIAVEHFDIKKMMSKLERNYISMYEAMNQKNTFPRV